jgi:hypothetical protein
MNAGIQAVLTGIRMAHGGAVHQPQVRRRGRGPSASHLKAASIRSAAMRRRRLYSGWDSSRGKRYPTRCGRGGTDTGHRRGLRKAPRVMVLPRGRSPIDDNPDQECYPDTSPANGADNKTAAAGGKGPLVLRRRR